MIWSADIYLKCVSSLVEEMDGSSTAKFYMAYSIILSLLTSEPLIIFKVLCEILQLFPVIFF